MIDEILRYNREFVASKTYEPYQASKYPSKRIAIVTCMDTRLTLLLPTAMGLRDGDVKTIKNAGGLITDPWGEGMRSLIVAIYELGVDTVMIIAHTGCGVQGMEADEMLHLMHERGIADEAISEARAATDIDSWLKGFDDTDEAVRRSVALVASHPLIPKGITVRGFVMDTATGALREVK